MMKIKIFFAGLVFCSAWQANGQTEFAPLEAEWHYTYTFGCCPEEHFNRIISEKDTIVEGNNCRVLKQHYDNSNIVIQKYIIKQEQGKVFYYYQDQFNLLFDFDAEINDIVEFTFMYSVYDYGVIQIKDTILTVRYFVEDITINGQNLKTFRTKVLDEDAYKFLGVYDAPYTYTYNEKIGLYSEFMPMLDNASHPDVDIFRWLRCYSDTDFSFISDEWAAISLPCDYSTATNINILKDENTKIYPNPFNDNVFVFTNDGKDIEIIDVSGKVVYYSELSNGINKISASHFLKGIYLVKIQNKDNRIQIFKIVKS